MPGYSALVGSPAQSPARTPSRREATVTCSFCSESLSVSLGAKREKFVHVCCSRCQGSFQVKNPYADAGRQQQMRRSRWALFP